jgi:ATP-dependent exoDNAse (exonuclease V) beta subunit
MRFLKLLSGVKPDLPASTLKQLELYGLMRALVIHFRIDPGDSYVRFFLDAILRFVRTRNGSLSDFVNWWEEEKEKASVIIPEGIDAVRIMTIHKAKGLQFPTVIFPFADEEVRATRKNLWVEVPGNYYQPVGVACLPVQKSLEGTPFKELYIAEIERSMVDMVNVLYVALTRPEERLYVLTRKLPEKTEKLNSVPKIFSYFFQQEGMYGNDKPAYVFGERTRHAPAVQKLEDARDESSRSVPGRLSLNLLLRRHAPSVWDMNDPDRNREWGNLVHLVMSRIKDKDDADRVIRDIARQGLVRESHRAKLRSVIQSILEHPGVSGFFEPGLVVRNEPEILMQDGKGYRPDRVVFRDGEAIVIDYKTGRPYPGHRDQVVQYMDLLLQMNYRVREAWLVYLDNPPEMVPVFRR